MTSRGWLFGAAVLGLLASACSLGGQSGGEFEPASGCPDTSSRAVAPDEMTGAGSVESLAASVEQAASVPMHVSDHEGADFDTVLTLTASIVPTSGVFHEFETPGPVRATACSPFLSVHALVHFDAADGSFMDVFSGVLETGGGQTVFTAELPLDEHAGTLDLTSLSKKNYVDPFFSLRTTLGTQPSGQLFLDGGSTHHDPNTHAVSASIANWP